MQLRIALIATFLLPLVGCISAKSRIHTQLEIDRIQLLNEGIEKEEARKRSLRLALEKIRRKEISPRHVPPTVKLHPPAAAKPDETETVADSSDEWMSHYYSGLSQVSEQAYEKAVAEFQRFIDGDPTHVYADRAQFWIVESHYRNKEYSLCVLTANDFMMRFPDSVRVPDTLYRRGLALGSMGEFSAASESLKELLRRAPRGKLADRATSHLAKWHRGGTG